MNGALAQRQGSRGILFSLWGFAFLSYLLRTNISVAQQQMARELHWSDVQVGYIFAAFLIGYTIFQVPAGILGDRFGPRLVLGISGVLWAASTLLTGLIPGGAIPLALLLGVRFAHGIEEATTYPVAMAAVGDWYPPRDHAFINSVIFTGSTLGAAFAPPLVANIMNALGWRASFYITAVLPLVLAAFWWRQTRGREHHGSAGARTHRETHKSLRLFCQTNLLLLCLSYFLYCYAISIFVYWLFKYLVDVRHLSIVNSGWANSLPWIVASVTVPILGAGSRRLSARIGALPGRRWIAVSCLCISALLMFVAAGARETATALAAIAASVGLLFSTEASYWSTAIELATENAGAASGMMNLAGNLGGVAASLAVPLLVARFGWFTALLSGSALAVLGALCWFFVHAPASAATKFCILRASRKGFFELRNYPDLAPSSTSDYERLYRLQVEELHDYALFLIGTDGVIQGWNSGVETILQYTRAEFEGKRFEEIFTAEDRQAQAPQKEIMTATRYGRSADVRWHVRKDGTQIFAEGMLYAILENDQVIGFSKVMRDATARHEAEEALRRSRDDLAEFAHVVAHDLQTPLRTIRSYAQLLARQYQGRFDESADTFLSFLLEGATNMESLIAGLLQYAEFGDAEPQETFSLNALMDAVLGALRGPIEESRAEIECGQLPVIDANAAQMQQLFQNLLANAIKYRSAASPRVRIEAVRQENFWLFSVADNGLGIAREHYDRIFLPLKRLHGHDIPGTGLGLAVCKRIVENSGGRIWVESTPGQGSTFYFTLPVTRV